MHDKKDPAIPNTNIAVLVYNDVELVDMNGPTDVFIHANSYNNSRYQIYTVAAESAAVFSEEQIISITPQYTIKDCPEPDIVIIPGIMKNNGNPGIAAPAIINWLKEKGDISKILMSVCIGAYSLAETGLLNSKRATTHYLSIDNFHSQYPGITIVKNLRFVEDGHLVTTGEITSGIDGALHLIKKLDGETIARQVADLMVYNRDAPLPPNTIIS